MTYLANMKHKKNIQIVLSLWFLILSKSAMQLYVDLMSLGPRVPSKYFLNTTSYTETTDGCMELLRVKTRQMFKAWMCFDLFY